MPKSVTLSPLPSPQSFCHCPSSFLTGRLRKWLNCCSWEKQPHPLFLPSKRRVVSFQDVSWEVFSPTPHHLATLAGERRVPSLSQIPSQVHQWPGDAVTAVGTGGEVLVALIPTPSGVTASLPALPSVPQGTEGRAWLWAPQLFWRAAVRRRTDGGVCYWLPRAAPAHSEFCSPPLLRFLLANGTLPKWRGGEGCKPKLHL